MSRPGQLGAVVVDGDDIVLTGPYLQGPRRVPQRQVVAIGTGFVVDALLARRPRVLPLGRRFVSGRVQASVNVVFATPQLVQGFTPQARQGRVFRRGERQAGVWADIVTVPVADADDARRAVTGTTIEAPDELAPTLVRLFGSADPLTLATRRWATHQWVRMLTQAGTALSFAVGLAIPATLARTQPGLVTPSAVLLWVAALLVAQLAGRALTRRGRDKPKYVAFMPVMGALAIGMAVGVVLAIVEHNGAWLALVPATISANSGIAAGLFDRAGRAILSDSVYPEAPNGPRAPLEAADRHRLRTSRLVVAASVAIAVGALGFAVRSAQVSQREYAVPVAGPAAAPLTDATADAVGRAITSDTGVSLPWEAVDPAELDGGTAVYAYFLPQARINVEQFDTAADAARYHVRSVHQQMDATGGFSRHVPPVEGATAFTCSCGAALVEFVRGAVRVEISVPVETPDARGEADDLAREVDATLPKAP